MNAKPMFSIDRIVFWFVVIITVAGLAYQTGFDNGFEKARVLPAACKDYSPEGKKLSSVVHSPKNNVTTCNYIRETYGRGIWQRSL